MKINILTLLIVGLCLLTPIVKAEDKVCVYIFYGKTCPHCAQEKSFLEELKTKYPQLEVHEFEVYFDSESRQLFEKISEAYHTQSSGVPMTFIGERAFIGFAEGNTEIYDSKSNAYVGYSAVIEKTIKDYIDEGGVDCPSPDVTITVPENQTEVSDLPVTPFINDSNIWMFVLIPLIVVVIIGLLIYRFRLIAVKVKW